MKPDTTIIGPGDPIKIPLQSEKTTAEGELAVIIGRACRDVGETAVSRGVAGYTTAFPPDFLVSFHSKVMTLLPGEIISTGTPGAVEIKDGDRVECVIDGFARLANPVEDLKK